MATKKSNSGLMLVIFGFGLGLLGGWLLHPKPCETVRVVTETRVTETRVTEVRVDGKVSRESEGAQVAVVSGPFKGLQGKIYMPKLVDDTRYVWVEFGGHNTELFEPKEVRALVELQ